MNADARNAMIVRIRKLLALADSPNENEAASAAAKAQELLTKYNLDLIEVAAAEVAKSVRDRYIRDEVTIGGKYDAGLFWKRDLLSAIARTNFCRAVVWVGVPVITLIGEPVNVEVVRMMYDYLVTTIDRLSAEGWADLKARNGGKPPIVESSPTAKSLYSYQHPKQFRSSFSAGCVSTVARRLAAMRNEQKADAGVSALVILKDEELAEASEELIGKTRKQTVKRTSADADAYRSGKRAGEDISLEKQVGGASAKALAG
jgi:hypothetical protein